jgi:hypothetical protein
MNSVTTLMTSHNTEGIMLVRTVAAQYELAGAGKGTRTAVLGTITACTVAAGSIWYAVDGGAALAPISTRLLMLLRPGHPENSTPLIASMADNLPSTWASFYYNLHLITMAMPAGLCGALTLTLTPNTYRYGNACRAVQCSLSANSANTADATASTG